MDTTRLGGVVSRVRGCETKKGCETLPAWRISEEGGKSGHSEWEIYSPTAETWDISVDPWYGKEIRMTAVILKLNNLKVDRCEPLELKCSAMQVTL